jgi:hypothetical protein
VEWNHIKRNHADSTTHTWGSHTARRIWDHIHTIIYRMLRRIFVHMRGNVTWGGRNTILCISHQILSGLLRQGGLRNFSHQILSGLLRQGGLRNYALMEEWYTIDLKEIGCEVLDWIYLAPNIDRWLDLVITVINIQIS